MRQKSVGRWRGRASEGRAPPSPYFPPSLPMLAIAPTTISGAEGTGGDEHGNTALGDSLTSWGCQPIAKLKGTLLEWSTVDEVSGPARNTKRKQCLFCGFHFTGGLSLSPFFLVGTPNSAHQRADARISCIDP